MRWSFALAALVTLLVCAFSAHGAEGAAVWSTAHNRLQLNGVNVTLHGIGTTTTEYLLRGIGMKSFATYQWNDPSNIITTLNTAEVDALVGFLKQASHTTNNGIVKPCVRIPLTASYWLGVVTNDARSNFNKYPNLGTQYQTLISKLVDAYTGAGAVVVLDLHWNDDDSMQQPMALKTSSSGPTGNAITFWDSIAAKFGSNPMVFYELYNEPHISDMDAYMNGNSQYAGMLEMMSTVRSHNPNAVCIIAGAAAYAYDANSLVELDPKIPSGANVMWNFHPYMGPAQSGARNKCPSGLEAMLNIVLGSTDRPVMFTEFGQACCATSGSCEGCDDTYNGQTMGYDHEVVAIAKPLGVSWMPWAWRPGAGSTGGSQCEDLNGGPSPPGLSLVHPTNGQGADWQTLWKEYA